ncbi:AraC family transcriptional regulator [Paenibacillus shenyangensis]|uniref:AraC family transcriptional regulator n=1 Tax=Paenibacillus sp. A9 TaxID=1284352 RepID=UPI000365EA75|nr:AraC family transcriptional regulator [Paenibacillus sp. A9]
MPETMRMDHAITYGYRSAGPFHPPAIDGFHSHLQYEIYYFHEGICTYIIGEHSYHLRPGDVLLMHGRTLHRPHPEPDHPYVRSTLHFDPTLLHEYIRPEHIGGLLLPFEQSGNRRISLSREEQPELEQLLAQLALLPLEEQGRVSFRFILKLCELLSMLASRCQEEQTDSNRAGKELYVQHILDYIETRYMHEITLEQIAEHLHLSRAYITSLFKEWTGMTIFKYLYHRRISQARLLLHYQRELSITEISRLSGFKQLPHFSRVFKEIVGCSPESYRSRPSSASTVQSY